MDSLLEEIKRRAGIVGQQVRQLDPRQKALQLLQQAGSVPVDFIKKGYNAFGRGLGGYLESDQQVTPQSDAERIGRGVGQLDTQLTMQGQSLGPLGMGPALVSGLALKTPKIAGQLAAKVAPKVAQVIPEAVSLFRKAGDTFVESSDIVAREKFNIPQLTKLSAGGSDRDVYDLGDNVLKIAKSARGLAQNEAGVDWYAIGEGLIPNIIEIGKNYNVAEKVAPVDANVRAMLKEINKVGSMYQIDGRGGAKTNLDNAQKVFDIMEKHGYPGSELANYDLEDLLWRDLMAPRNWGVKGGKPILLDEGTLGGRRMIKNYEGLVNLSDPAFREVYYQSKQAKKLFGDTDKNTMYGAIPALGLPSFLNNEQENK